MASQLDVRRSTIGVINTGDGSINIHGNVEVGSSTEESFEEFDPPRESEVFKGREEDISKLEALFFREGKRKVVIHGLPGFGKTELAVQFAKHCIEKDSTYIDKAFWINAETSENLKRLHKTLKKVYKTFENKRCLFIFDNGISRSSIRQFEPPKVEHFYLLITSHISDWDDDIYQMPLEPLNMEASLDVFRATLGDSRYKSTEEKIYEQMIRFVDNTPLGLIVISGHLRFKMDACTQGTFDTNHFFGEISKMLNTKIHHCQRSYENSIYAAMCVALDKIFIQEFAESEQLRELTKKLLGICAYLNPDRIYISEIKEIMECSDKNMLDECVYLSKNFSFVQYNEGVIKIHRLCQRILKLYFREVRNDYYSICLRYVLRNEHWFNRHEDTILKEADIEKAAVLEIYQQNVSENHYRHIGKLLTLLVEYDCCESCKLIFHKISFEKRKQFVDNNELIHVAIRNNHVNIFREYENIHTVRILLEAGADVNILGSRGKTPLHLAIRIGNIDIVRMLLVAGADVNILDSRGKTPLHWANWIGSIDIVRLLLKEGADLHVRDNEGKTPLHWPVWMGNIDIVRLLLEEGADVNVLDSEGKTPLHWASLKENIDIVRILLEAGADVNSLDSRSKTPLHLASEVGNIDSVRILLEEEADVNVLDSEGLTPLQWPIWIGNIDIVQILLEAGADVNIVDSAGQTPLHWASSKGYIDTVRTLLEKGADVNNLDSRGKTPLHLAVWIGNIDIVRLLLKEGADVHVRDNEGKTPLHLATCIGNIDIVRLLLEEGADVNVLDSEGKTPLHWASVKENIDIVRMLLEKRADVNVLDSAGKTPLHRAIWLGSISIVRLLLDEGADVDVRDNEGRTSLDSATFCGHAEIIHLLLMNELAIIHKQ